MRCPKTCGPLSYCRLLGESSRSNRRPMVFQAPRGELFKDFQGRCVVLSHVQSKRVGGGVGRVGRFLLIQFSRQFLRPQFLGVQEKGSDGQIVFGREV